METAVLFEDESGQTVRLPAGYHLPGERVRVRRFLRRLHGRPGGHPTGAGRAAPLNDDEPAVSRARAVRR